MYQATIIFVTDTVNSHDSIQKWLLIDDVMSTRFFFQMLGNTGIFYKASEKVTLCF